MSKRRWTDEDLIEGVRICDSISDVLRYLKLIPAGGSYILLHGHIKRLGLDTSHFTGKLWSKGRKLSPRKSLDEVLVDGKLRSSNSLKKRLIREGIKDYICEHCNQSEWFGKPIPLELDHINGIKSDNRLGNIRLLCPNCHSFTETYRGRNISSRPKSVEDVITDRKDREYKKQEVIKRNTESGINKIAKIPKISNCPDCSKPVSGRSSRCKACDNKFRFGRNSKIEWPSVEYLLEELKTKPMVKVAKELGVSDNAVKKHIRMRTKTV